MEYGKHHIHMDDLEKCYAAAIALLQDKHKTDSFLQRLDEKLKDITPSDNKAAIVPAMASLLKSYLSKNYTDIPLGAIIAITNALIYFVSPIGLVSDKLSAIYHFDDNAIIVTCWLLVKPEIEKYIQWCENNKF